MNHIITDFVNKLIDSKSKPIWDSIESLRQEIADLKEIADSYADALRTLEATVEADQENLENHNRMLATHADNLKNNNLALATHADNLKNSNLALEQYRCNIKNNNQTLEAYGRNLKSVNQALDEYGSNIKNNNQILEAYGQELKNSRLLIEQLPAFYDLAEKLGSQVDMLDLKVSRLRRKQPPAVTANIRQIPQADAAEAGAEGTYEGIDYFDFENHFRGSREHVKRVQDIYLPYFEGCKAVVDLGCGRGEFLELLKEHEIGAVGVDLYDEFTEYCVKKGLKATCMDAVRYLEEVNETDGIFASQLVEHLQTSQVIRLCRLAYEKLKEGSYMILETPNPTSLAIYANSFYIDPSHEKPVHPQTLKYFMQKAGFSDIQVIYTQNSTVGIQIPRIKTEKNEEPFNAAMEQVQNTLFGSQDYALIARK